MELYSVLTMLLVVAFKLLHLQAGKTFISDFVPIPTCTPMIIGSTVFPCYERLQRGCPEMPVNESNPGAWIRRNCVDPTLPTVVTPFFNRSNTVFNHTRTEGDNVVLRCHVNRFNENFILKWTKWDKETETSEPIFSSNMETSINSRRNFSMLYSWNNESVESVTAELQIFRLSPNDAGKYECVFQQISGVGSLSDEQVYMVAVRYPAQVRSIGPRFAPFWSSNQPGRIYVNETGNITLTCTADGFPTPTMSWRLARNHGVSRKIKSLTNPDGSLFLSRITRNYSGTYICSARNVLNKKRWASKSVELVVQHSPQSERSYVDRKVAASRYVLLESSFTGLPTPTYLWLKNGKPLSPKNNSSEAVSGSGLVIIVLDPDKHYANYTCVGTNLLGSANTTFDVNGRPYPPQILNTKRLGRRRRSFELYWSPGLNDVHGIPVTAYNVLYRRIEIKRVGNVMKVNYYPNDAPNSVIVPGDINRYYLTELKENSTYETAVCPSNAYGKGKCTNFTFFTPNEDIIIAPTVIEETENQAELSLATPLPVFTGRGSCRVTPSLGCLLSMVSLVLFCLSNMGISQSNEKT